MDGVLSFILAIDGSEGLGSDIPGHFGVMGATQLPKLGYHILLPDLKRHTRSISQFLNQGVILLNNILINLKEFLHY